MSFDIVTIGFFFLCLHGSHSMKPLLPLVVICLLLGGSIYGSFIVFGQEVTDAQAQTEQLALAVEASVTPTSTLASLLSLAPLVEPSATPIPITATPEPSATLTPSPTLTPSVTNTPQVHSASFQVHDAGMRHNIMIALDANNGALRRVVIPPGGTFSFNDSLGPNPNRLRWKNVGRTVSSSEPASDQFVYFGKPLLELTPMPGSGIRRSTPVPGNLPVPEQEPVHEVVPEAPPAEAAPQSEQQPVVEVIIEPVVVEEPTPTATPQRIYVLGGGVCDLASRYVVAGRRILPDKAFNFKRHTGGIAGVRYQDAVSIWTTDNGLNDNDLEITNTTERWLVFEATITGNQVTVNAWLQDGP